MNQSNLFSTFDDEPELIEDRRAPGSPRLRRADRTQVEFRPLALDALLADDHQARAVWEYVESLDLSECYAAIRSLENGPGRSPIDPRILLCLWIYATLEGVGSARALGRLCTEHVAYQWICGGVSVNYHTLADFRGEQVSLLDRLLTQSVAVLRHAGLVSLNRVAQDGMRVRANAGAPSFRRKPKLEAYLKEAEQQIDALRKELDEDPSATDRQERASRLRAAEDRKKRVSEALRHIPLIEAKKESAEEKAKARASMTDPEARVMKMPDGGFRPGYNVQFATDTGSQVIVGVDVTNQGNDFGLMGPMIQQIKERHGETPSEYLVDGGFAAIKDIIEVTENSSCAVFAPVMTPKKTENERRRPVRKDQPAIAEWRSRMATEQAREIYKERAATSECVNAAARNRGLSQFRVRGVRKTRGTALLYALAHNTQRTITLRREARRSPAR